MSITVFNLFQEGMIVNNTDGKSIIEKLKETYFNQEIECISVADTPLKDCIGCWHCWVKTPGICLHKDAMVDYYDKFMTSDKVIFLFPTGSGFLKGYVKTFIDRLIPLAHPYIEIVEGEMMHKYRYETYPELDFYFSEEGLTTQENQMIEDYCYRVAYHFRVPAGRVTFNESQAMRTPMLQREPQEDGPWQPFTAQQKGKIILYNGSPRGMKGNSLILINQLIEGMKRTGLPADAFEIRHLVDQKHHETWVEDFENHSRHLFVFPLYVHSMPGIVMKFLEKLTPLTEKESVQMSFFVQSGFMEGYQSAYLLPYLPQLSKRLGAVYGGTVIKGGIEGIQIRPEPSLKSLFEKVNALGMSYIQKGCFDPVLAKSFGKPYKLSAGFKILFKCVEWTGLTNFYWNMQLKKNGAMDKCFDRPYARQ